MKFFTILALFGGINALRLHSHSHLPAHNLHNVAQVQLGTHHQVKNFIMSKSNRDVDLTDEQEAEIEAWVEEKLTTGDEEISKKEAEEGLKAFVKKHGMKPITPKEWEELEAIFDEVDSNGNGKLSYSELKTAWEAHEKDMEDALLQVKGMMRSKRDVDLTDEQEKEIEAWVEEKLTTGDEEISKKEAEEGLKAFVKKHGMKPITPKEWEELEAIFDAVDTNGNGKLSYSELKTAWEAHEEDVEDAFLQVKGMMRSKRDVDLTDEQEDEIEAWVEEKLTTGDKEISKEEAADGLKAFVKKHGMKPITPKEWEELEALFDEVDTNGNGKLSYSELKAAHEAHEGDDSLIQVKIKSLLKSKRDVDLTDEQEAEIEAWIKEKLSTGDNEISWKEAKQGLKAFVKKYEMKPITKKEWKELKKMFKSVDTDKNGKLSASELEAAWDAHMEEEKA